MGAPFSLHACKNKHVQGLIVGKMTKIQDYTIGTATSVVSLWIKVSNAPFLTERYHSISPGFIQFVFLRQKTISWFGSNLTLSRQTLNILNQNLLLFVRLN